MAPFPMFAAIVAAAVAAAVQGAPALEATATAQGDGLQARGVGTLAGARACSARCSCAVVLRASVCNMCCSGSCGGMLSSHGIAPNHLRCTMLCRHCHHTYSGSPGAPPWT